MTSSRRKCEPLSTLFSREIKTPQSVYPHLSPFNSECAFVLAVSLCQWRYWLPGCSGSAGVRWRVAKTYWREGRRVQSCSKIWNASVCRRFYFHLLVQHEVALKRRRCQPGTGLEFDGKTEDMFLENQFIIWLREVRRQTLFYGEGNTCTLYIVVVHAMINANIKIQHRLCT